MIELELVSCCVRLEHDLLKPWAGRSDRQPEGGIERFHHPHPPDWHALSVVVAHDLRSSLRPGNGIAPIVRLHAAGVRAATGTDNTCIVHLIRNSLDWVSEKDRRAGAVELTEIYRAKNADAGNAALEAFDTAEWRATYPAIPMSWWRHWQPIDPAAALDVSNGGPLAVTETEMRRPAAVVLTGTSVDRNVGARRTPLRPGGRLDERRLDGDRLLQLAMHWSRGCAGRSKHGQALANIAVEKLAGDQGCLDRLADAIVVRDQTSRSAMSRGTNC